PVGDEPADDIWERFGGVLDSINLLDLLELTTAAGCDDRELLREYTVHADVIAEEDVWTARDIVDAHEDGAVDEVLHDPFQRVPSLGVGDGRVRRRRDPDMPPHSTHAPRTFSGFIRFVFQIAGAPAYVMRTGRSYAAIMS